MEKFASIHDRACERKGGEAALRRLLPRVRSARALANTGDDRYLVIKINCHCIFSFIKTRKRHNNLFLTFSR